jgi:lipid A 3-O-deacylase
MSAGAGACGSVHHAMGAFLRLTTTSAAAIFQIFLVAAFTGSASAETEHTSALSFGTGWFDVVQKREPAVEALVELRTGRAARPLRAIVVATLIRDSSSFLAAGIGYEVRFGRRWVLTPTFAPGYYRKGDGKDLGSPLEFRSQIELGYEYGARHRLSIAFSHMSNAGLGRRNPGEESLTLAWQVPLGHHPTR